MLYSNTPDIRVGYPCHHCHARKAASGRILLNYTFHDYYNRHVARFLAFFAGASESLRPTGTKTAKTGEHTLRTQIRCISLASGDDDQAVCLSRL